VKESDAIRDRIGLLSSSGGSYPVLTAAENLGLAMSLTGKGSQAGAQAALEKVGLADASSKQVRYFSSGMKKRLGLARVLLVDADLWLLDEPYAALDEDGKRLVDVCLAEARSRGRTVILASHEQDRDHLAPDAVVELADGRLRLVSAAGRAAGEATA
jgi:ABC-type multidrug transport system ATPase subunit